MARAKAWASVLSTTFLLLSWHCHCTTVEDGAPPGPETAGATNEAGAIHSDGCILSPVDYVVVGAGSAGIQAAVLLHSYNLSYVVIEQASSVGVFWDTFPTFEELISVNKWVRDERQGMRFDWHSLLSTPLRMSNITEAYFPTRRDMKAYLSEVAAHMELNIVYNMRVESVKPNGCVVLSTGEHYCAQRRLLVGTGMREKQEIHLRSLGGIPYSAMRRNIAYHRRVCILGNGNSGWEVAQNVYDIADRVTLYGKRPTRWSAITRYTGDVRLKSSQILENFNSKLLDTVSFFAKGRTAAVFGLERVATEQQIERITKVFGAAAWLAQDQCEVFVIATGFQSHVPGRRLNARFPPTGAWWKEERTEADDELEAAEHSGSGSTHYIGWLMHERDFQRGAGGFLSGFRFLIRSLVHHIREADHGFPFPCLELAKEELIGHVVTRIQTAADLVVMQDGVVLRDMAVPTATGGYRYYNGVPYEFFFENSYDPEALRDIIFVYFMWGDTHSASIVFNEQFQYNDSGRLANGFLHPVVEVNGMVRHMQEDLEMTWYHAAHETMIASVMRAAMDGDFTMFEPGQSFELEDLTFNQPSDASDFERAFIPVGVPEEVQRAVVMSVLRPNRTTMHGLRDTVREWMPHLFEHFH